MWHRWIFMQPLKSWLWWCLSSIMKTNRSWFLSFVLYFAKRLFQTWQCQQNSMPVKIFAKPQRWCYLLPFVAHVTFCTLWCEFLICKTDLYHVGMFLHLPRLLLGHVCFFCMCFQSTLWSMWSSPSVQFWHFCLCSFFLLPPFGLAMSRAFFKKFFFLLLGCWAGSVRAFWNVCSCSLGRSSWHTSHPPTLCHPSPSSWSRAGLPMLKELLISVSLWVFGSWQTPSTASGLHIIHISIYQQWPMLDLFISNR